MLNDVKAPALLIIDNLKEQITESVNQMSEESNVNVCLLPTNSTYCLQPLDISVIKPLKLVCKGSLWSGTGKSWQSS